MSHTTAVFACEFFPNIDWFAHWLQHEQACIDIYEYFERASLRNRYYVGGANGIQMLSVPLAGGRNQKKCMYDISISPTDNWASVHWKTLISCYNRSPYFEYYADDLQSFFTGSHTSLTSSSLQALALICKLLRIRKPIITSSSYISTTTGIDYRKRYTADNYMQYAQQASYYQVFQDKWGFHTNLSILDLLCCAGPDSLSVLQQLTTH